MQYGPEQIEIRAPSPNGSGPQPLNVTVAGLPPHTTYRLSSSPAGTVLGPWSSKRPHGHKGLAGPDCAVSPSAATTDQDGTLQFKSPLGVDCVTSASAE